MKSTSIEYNPAQPRERQGRPRIRQRLTLGLVALCVAALASACSDSGSGSDGSVDKITIGYIDQAGAPDTVVKANGWMEEAYPDAEVKWAAFSTGADVIRALASGDIQFGHAGSVPAVSAISQQVPVKIVWINSINATAEALAVGPDINSVKDLVGKRIGVPFGTTAQYSFSVALREAGVDASKVDIIDLSPADAGAAYQRGDIDGAYTYAPGLTIITDNGGQEILSSADVAKAGFPTTNLDLVTTSFAKDHPEVVTKWVGLLDRGTREYQAQQDKTIQLVQDDLDVPRAALDSIMTGVIWVNGKDQLTAEYLGTEGKPGTAVDTLSDMADFMSGANQISRVPSPEDFQAVVDTSYLADAMAKQN